MSVEKIAKLGLEGNEFVDIMDVKCDPEMTSMIIQTFGFLPGYHMNKTALDHNFTGWFSK